MMMRREDGKKAGITVTGSKWYHTSFMCPIFNLPNSQIRELFLLPSLTGTFGKKVIETKKLFQNNKKNVFFQCVYGNSDNKYFRLLRNTNILYFLSMKRKA